MLGDKLKLLRNLKKFTQKQVAEKLKISEVRYNQYETNRRSPDYELIKDIAKFYEVSIDYIMDNEKNSTKFENEAKQQEILKEILVKNGYTKNKNDITNEEINNILRFLGKNREFFKR